MMKRFRKILSILCAFALLVCAGTVFAEEELPAIPAETGATEAEVTDVDFPEMPSEASCQTLSCCCWTS